MGLSEEEEEELVLDIPQPVVKAGSRKKKVEIDPEIIEAARQVALKKKELECYGVSHRLFIIFKNSNQTVLYRELGSGRTTTRRISKGMITGMLELKPSAG